MILDYFGFALLRLLIGPENLSHPLNQLNAKVKTNPNFATGVFPRIKQVAEFSLVNDDAALFLLVVVITLVLVL